MIRTLLVPAAAAGLFAATAAEAQHWREGERRSIVVDVAALDLSTRAGLVELDRRIGRAVDRICGSDRWCREDAWASTEAQARWAIGRDRWMRRMAEERLAQLEACRRQRCGPPPQQPAYHPAPPPRPTAGGVTITIVHSPGAPPPRIEYWQY